MIVRRKDVAKAARAIRRRQQRKADEYLEAELEAQEEAYEAALYTNRLTGEVHYATSVCP